MYHAKKQRLRPAQKIGRFQTLFFGNRKEKKRKGEKEEGSRPDVVVGTKNEPGAGRSFSNNND